MSAPRILVVDDELHITRVLKMCLEEAGYEVTLAPDGREALELLNWELPDLLISDIMMPRMSGRDLCTKVREVHPPSLPILVMTSSSEDEHRSWAYELPNVTLLEKPVSPRRLLERIAELIGKADAAP